MSFRLVLKLVTLNDLERRNNPYFAFFTELGSFRGALRRRLSSSVVCNAAGGRFGRHVVGRQTLHGGPVRLRPVRATPYYYFRHFDVTLKSGTFGVPGWSCRDAGDHGRNPGHPEKFGTGGNPTSTTGFPVSILW